MKKILITGMTSPQSSRRLNEKSLSFAGALSSILEDSGHAVEWAEPSVFFTKEDLKGFDVILLGIAPALSVTSNKAYGVLSMIDLLGDDDRLRLFIDTPEPSRITANLRALEKDISQIFKSFYSLRKHYRDVVPNESVKSAIANGVDRLRSSEWPSTLYPATPWSEDLEVAAKLPERAVDSLSGVFVDSYYVRQDIARISADKVRRWLIDTTKTKWAERTTHTLSLPHHPMKENKGATDEAVFNGIARSIGSLISPTGDGQLWWSYRLAQSMNATTPIASDWRVTSKIGSSWSHLAAGIEEMSYIDMYELSVSQKEEYIKSLPSRDIVKEKLETALGIKKK